MRLKPVREQISRALLSGLIFFPLPAGTCPTTSIVGLFFFYTLHLSHRANLPDTDLHPFPVPKTALALLGDSGKKDPFAITSPNLDRNRRINFYPVNDFSEPWERKGHQLEVSALTTGAVKQTCRKTLCAPTITSRHYHNQPKTCQKQQAGSPVFCALRHQAVLARFPVRRNTDTIAA